MITDPVDRILVMYGIRGPWQPLRATGVANRIYDARTELVAAPAAWARR